MLNGSSHLCNDIRFVSDFWEQIFDIILGTETWWGSLPWGFWEKDSFLKMKPCKNQCFSSSVQNCLAGVGSIYPPILCNIWLLYKMWVTRKKGRMIPFIIHHPVCTWGSWVKFLEHPPNTLVKEGAFRTETWKMIDTKTGASGVRERWEERSGDFQREHSLWTSA